MEIIYARDLSLGHILTGVITKPRGVLTPTSIIVSLRECLSCVWKWLSKVIEPICSFTTSV